MGKIMDTDGKRRLPPLAREGLWVAALGVSLGLLFVRNPPLGYPLGSDWEQYLAAARYFF